MEFNKIIIYMKCKECEKEKPIVNSFFKMCRECNYKRLEDRKSSKMNTLRRTERKSLKTKETRLKRNVGAGERVSRNKGGKKPLKNFDLDELFYEKCFHNSDHKCEECSKNLPTEFKDDAGRVISRFRYSHIVAKSIAPELRHDLNNINHLCHECHFKWDFQDRKNMKIYSKNKSKYPQFLK